MTVTQDVQVELDGLLLGRGTKYGITKFNPWISPVWRSSDIDAPYRSGVIAGNDLYGARRVPLELAVLADDKPEAIRLVQGLAAAWHPRDRDLELTWQDGAKTYVMIGRPRLCDPDPGDLEIANGVFGVECRFLCTDSLIYSAAEHSATTTALIVGKGRTYNRSYDWRYGTGGEGGWLRAINDGTAPAPWVAQIVGPCNQPRITIPSGAAMEFSDVLGVGDVMRLNSRLRSVEVNGAARYGTLEAGSQWFDIPPGGTLVSFTSQDSQGTLTMTNRDAWW